jgi:hypothetical protein
MTGFRTEFLLGTGFALLLAWTLLGSKGTGIPREDKAWRRTARNVLPYVILFLVLLAIGHWVFQG